MNRRLSLALLAAVSLAACASPAPNTPRASGSGTISKTTPGPVGPSAGNGGANNPTSGPSTAGSTAPVLAPLRAVTAIAGTVTAPASLVAAGGLNLIGADGATLVAAGAGNMVAAGAGNLVAAGAGNIVAAGAGNLISDDGSNIVAAGAGNYALKAAGTGAFLPVPRARVYLTAGDVVLPIAPVETDEDGNYTFPKVPAGVTYQVVVSVITPAGKTGRLASLVRPDEKGAVANVSPVTTMVCAATVGTKKGLGDVDPSALKAATDAVGELIAKVTGEGIDLADPKSLPAKVEALVATDAAASTKLGVLKTAVAADPKDAAAIGALIESLDVATCAVGDVLAAPSLASADDFSLPAAPSAIAVAPDETLYLGDRERGRVVVIGPDRPDAGRQPAATATRVIDGVEPLALAVAGDALYVGDAKEGQVLRIAADGTRTALTTDQRYEPTAIAVAEDGTVYFTDATRHAVFSVGAAGGAATLLVGGRPGFADGEGANAKLYRPSGLALVGNALYVADAGNRRIRRVTLGGAPAIAAFAGSGAAGDADGAAAEARFGYPAAIAADGTGTLWVADAATGTIRRVTTAGVVETVLDGGCVLDAKGLGFHGGLTFARAALYVLDGDRVVRRPVGPQPSPSAAPASPAASASPDSTSASPAAPPSSSPAASSSPGSTT